MMNSELENEHVAIQYQGTEHLQKWTTWIFGILDSLTLLSSKESLYLLKKSCFRSEERNKSNKEKPTKIKEWTIIINQANVHYIVNIW